MSENKIPCRNCGSTDWSVTDINFCDNCDPMLNPERLDQQLKCPHEHTTESRIFGISKCLDCGLVGVELFKGSN